MRDVELARSSGEAQMARRSVESAERGEGRESSRHRLFVSSAHK
jgi:hypothetical protein